MKPLSGNGFHVVLFWFMNDWGSFGRAYEKIAENLSTQDAVRSVLVVMPPVRIHDVFGVLPFKLRKESKKLFVLTPNVRIIPQKYEFGSVGRKLNGKGVPFAITRFMKFLSFRESDTILWVYPPHPYIDDLVRFVPHKTLVSQIVDNSIFKERDQESRVEFARKQYDELSKASDVVITSSQLNYDYFSQRNSSCFLYENAVDPVFLGSPSFFPHAAGNGRRPRIGYAGYISERTDTELLRLVAEKRPDYDLVLAGPIEVPKAEFERMLLPNVRYEGVVPYERMPEFLRNLDICLIPHHDTRFSRSMSPLKLFQYLASGRPVVSTNVAGVDRWKHLISIADSHDEFLLRIDETLLNDSMEKSQERISAARLETWDRRVKDMLNAVVEAAGMA
ncbi:MAG: glycosyltransferase [Deltaproteobacteria bacterium]|nr:glycosyltransferase [Deltaproteobacteria bacterium]